MSAPVRAAPPLTTKDRDRGWRRAHPGTTPSPTRFAVPASYHSVMSRIVTIVAIACVCAANASAAPSARVGEAKVSLAVPSGWHSWVPSRAIKPTITDPLTRVVAVSAPFTFGTGGCQVDYAFPANAVAVVVLEWVPTKGLAMPSHLPQRPSSFDSKTLTLRPHSAECFDGPAGVVEFTDHGRSFSASIQAGTRATPAVIARARAVLNSFRVD